jgi:hypothetical protein
MAAALAAMAACSRGPSQSAPIPASVDPPTGSAHRPVPVTIHGEGFYVRPVQDMSGGARVDSVFRAWLGETALEQVRWIDERTLEAVVPAGIAPGIHALTLEDPFGRRAFREGMYEATLAPAALDAAFVDLPASVNVGQPFVVTVELANAGEATALAVGADVGSVGAEPGAPPAPVDVPGGEARRVRRTFAASAAGDIALAATATGTDALSGGPVSAAPASASVLAQVPSALTAWFELAPQVTPGELRLTLAVANAGGAVALDVAPGPLVATGVPVALGAAPAPVPQLAGGATTRFVWPIRVDGTGVLDVSIVVTAVDANDARPLEVVASAIAEVREAALLATDPFGDGTPFAFVTGYGGDLVLGPSRHGTGLVRMAPDGSAPRSLSLSFPRDGTGNVSANKATPPYRSIGYDGCATDVVDGCGPDNEDGRGLLTSFTFAGEEWLLLAGSRAGGDLDYVYVTRESGPPLAFSYVDLSLLLGANTRGISAARAVGDRVYLGFPDNGGNRPYALSVLQLPTGLDGAGIDATPATHAIDLELDEALNRLVPNAKLASISIVDAIGDLGGRVYFLNDVGCVVSKAPEPAAWSDLGDCSPSSPFYDRLQSVEPTRQHDLEPWEKAWPQVAVWNGRLYAIRNLVHPTEGRAPQLWSCDPAGGADTAACDPEDWSLVAADASGLTRFGNPDATAATLLVATPAHFYVGFDDAVGGVRIYRTSAAIPLTAADFTGAGGCNAADSACPGLGGNGLTDPAANTRLLDAKAISVGGSTLVYASVGNGSGPMRIYRLPE